MFSANTYQERRAALKKLVGNGILLIPGNSEAGMNYKANAYPFWQDKNFLYYFGLQQADLAGVIDADNDLDILFGDELSLDDQVWTGVLPTLHSRAAQAGIANIMPSKKLGPMLRAAKKAGRQIHLLPPYRGDHTLQWSEWLGVPVKRLGDFISEDLIKAVVHQRVHKTAEEIAEIEAALAISKEIHESLMREVKPGMQEYYMLGRSLQIAANHGGRLAYGAIASVRGEVLHNVDYHRTIEAGQMVLCDLGAEGPSGYASDITRTFPANAAFSSFQKDIYQLVLNVEETAIGSLAPGVSYRDVHLNAALQFANGLPVHMHSSSRMAWAI